VAGTGSSGGGVVRVLSLGGRTRLFLLEFMVERTVLGERIVEGANIVRVLI
jgi:hypothetical protein